MVMESKGWAEIECTIEAILNSAILINDGVRSVWIPKSQIEDPDPSEMEIGGTCTLLIPEWLAMEKELI